MTWQDEREHYKEAGRLDRYDCEISLAMRVLRGMGIANPSANLHKAEKCLGLQAGDPGPVTTWERTGMLFGMAMEHIHWGDIAWTRTWQLIPRNCTNPKRLYKDCIAWLDVSPQVYTKEGKWPIWCTLINTRGYASLWVPRDKLTRFDPPYTIPIDARYMNDTAAQCPADLLLLHAELRGFVKQFKLEQAFLTAD